MPQMNIDATTLATITERLGREPRGLRAVILCDPSTTAAALTRYMNDHPLPGATVALDQTGKTYERFFVKAGFFGMPRVLLLDDLGKVTFEGDPGLGRGNEWQPDDGPTFVDDALDKLLDK